MKGSYYQNLKMYYKQKFWLVNIFLLSHLQLNSGVFVRIKDKNLHVECFKCATCGTPLKNQGYYNIHNKLYCDIHARLAALNSPPPNVGNGMVPVTIPP